MLMAEMTNAEVLERFRIQQDMIDKAVIDAMEPAVSIARTKAPKRTGDLRRGIVRLELGRHGLEQSKNPGKAVGEIGMDPGLNDTFVKMTKDGKRYYYPASKEYGFLHKDGFGGMYRMPGWHFLHATSRLYEPNMIEVAQRVVEAILLE